MSTELRVDTREFMASAARLLATSKRDHLVVMREQAKGVIREVIALTPPGRPGATKARGRGTAKVKADILKLVKGTSSEPKVQRRDIAAIHASRRRRGRVTSEISPRIVVPVEALRAYIKEKQARVGHLASGWNTAAAKLGYKPPAWVWRNEGPGAIEIRVSDKDLVIRATNRVAFASEISMLNRRIQAALNIQRNKMERRIASYLKRAATRSGFK
ncbi:MAG: hypothetical protein KDM63_18570 [Verrucomicrobiae bacterium]|nr:hypothetical protein [Verrucomicrobiae bacterium]